MAQGRVLNDGVRVRSGLVAKFMSALLGTVAAFGSVAAHAQYSAAPADLKRLSIEQLGALEISSVSKTPEPISGAPAAIYVITGEDIRRSGATTMAEILRLAPNLQVGRIGAGDYAVSARGFNIGTANKLLVLIDGRTVYTPLYSGVFWDMQNVAPVDIERIEVISGPGGTLWGSNAVNGVINVVTRNAADSQGGVARLSGGNADVNGVAQYGGRIGDVGYFRVYAQSLRQGHTLNASGASALDSWELTQAGLRTDWEIEDDTATVQGDFYDGANEPGGGAHIDLRGGNIVGRWRHAFAGDSGLEVQAYYDHSARAINNGIRDALDTYDLTAQHNFVLGQSHSIVWGGGYRVTSDHLTPGFKTSFLNPARRTLQLGNVFVQDAIRLGQGLKLAIGVKAEHNTYTGFEFMPDARLSWQVAPNALLWAAVSRAVRSPSRFDRDLYNTGILAGGPNFQSEQLVAYEVGYRGQPAPRTTLSVSFFYNVYDDLRTAEATTPVIFPLVLSNQMRGHTYGVEAWGGYDVLSWWRINAGVTALHKNLRLKPGSRDFFPITTEGNDPETQFSLRSQMSLPHGFEFDANMRAIASLPGPYVPSYVAVDARIGWIVSERLQLAVAGYNLFDQKHPEFIVSSPPQRQMRRTVYASARWGF